jgi:hypothetical protein
MALDCREAAAYKEINNERRVVMFEQTFKNIDDILHKDAGCTSELDYTEQSSWLLFLKYLDKDERDQSAMGRQHNND